MLPPVIRSRSLRLSGMASTRTRTSPGPGSGTATVSSCSTSSGLPYWCTRHARIVVSMASLLLEPEVLDVRAELRPHRGRVDPELLGGVAVDAVLPGWVVIDERTHAIGTLAGHRQVERGIDGLDLGELVGDEVREVHVVEDRVRVAPRLADLDAAQE